MIVIGVIAGVRCVAERVAAGLRRGIFIRQAGQHSCVEIVCAAYAMGDAAGGGRTGLRRIGPGIGCIIGVGGGMAQGINLLIHLSRVIPVGMAGDRTAAGVEPAAYRGLVAANAIRRRDMLRVDGRSGCGEIAGFVIRIIGLRHTIGGAVRH